MTAYRMQADPVVHRLREFLADGGVGRNTHLHGDFTCPVLGESRGPDQWRLDPELTGGGALPDVGVYPFNFGRFLLGADSTAASGVTAGDGAFAAVDETVSFVVEFRDGVSGAFSAWISGTTDTYLTVYGSEGQVTLEDAFQPRADRTVRVSTADDTATFEGLGANEVREQSDSFAHWVLTDTPPKPDGRDGLVDLRTMADVYRDAKTGVPMAE